MNISDAPWPGLTPDLLSVLLVTAIQAKGSVLMQGIKLKQGFGATGYAEDIRFFSDFGSRMYFMEEVE